MDRTQLESPCCEAWSRPSLPTFESGEGYFHRRIGFAFEEIAGQNSQHRHYGCYWTLDKDGLVHHAGAGCPGEQDSPVRSIFKGRECGGTSTTLSNAELREMYKRPSLVRFGEYDVRVRDLLHVGAVQDSPSAPVQPVRVGFEAMEAK